MSRRSPKILALAALTLLLASGCQAVFGDFSIDTSKLDAACTPNVEVRCTFASLQRCGADGMSWTTEQQCASSVLCDPVNVTCNPPTCDADATRCNDSELQRCSADRTQWVDTQACQSPQLCDPAAPTGCSDGPCTAKSVRCNDLTLEKCVAGVWADPTPCATRQLCDASGAGACKDPLCAIGEQQCVASTTLQTCKTTRDGWTETECPSKVCKNARCQ